MRLGEDQEWTAVTDHVASVLHVITDQEDHSVLFACVIAWEFFLSKKSRQSLHCGVLPYHYARFIGPWPFFC